MATKGPVPIFDYLQNVTPFPGDRKTDLINALPLLLKGQVGTSSVVIFDKWVVLVSLKKDKHKSKSTKLKASNVDIYVIDDVLGKGQAEVYLAHHIENDTPVAVKIQYEKDPSFETDLLRERRNLERMQRLINCFKVDALVPVYGAHIQREVHLTEMEYVSGINLLNSLYAIDTSGAFISKKPVDVVEVLHRAIAVLSELHSLWTKTKLVHRDIKTANFIISKKSKILELIDLGSAIDLTEDVIPQMKGKSSEVGREDAASVGYLPPEYLVDIKERPIWDTACDIWQAGIVIAEMLTTCNYQKVLVDFSLEASEKEKKDAAVFQSKHLTFEQIKDKMSDIFSLDEKDEKREKEEEKAVPLKSRAEIEKFVLAELKSLILKLTSSERTARPSSEQLIGIIRKLRKTYLEVHSRLTVIKAVRSPEQKDMPKATKAPLLRSVTDAHLVRPIKRIEVHRVGGVYGKADERPTSQTARETDDISRKRVLSGLSPRKLKRHHERERKLSDQNPSEHQHDDVVALVENFEELNLGGQAQAFHLVAQKRLSRLIAGLELKSEDSYMDVEKEFNPNTVLLSMYLTKMKEVVREPATDKFEQAFDSLLSLTHGYTPTGKEQGPEIGLVSIKSALSDIAKLKPKPNT